MSVWIAIGSLHAGCGGAQPASTGPSTLTQPPAASSRLDPELVELAARAPGADKIKLRVGADGAVHKLAVYHRNADAIPTPVRELVTAQFPGATSQYYESELYADLGRVYEVEVTTADGRQCEVAADAAGTLRYTECKLPIDQLPPPVRATVERLLPGGEILEVEVKQGPGLDEVSVEVRSGDVEHYLRTSAAGELLGHTLRIPAVVEVPLGSGF